MLAKTEELILLNQFEPSELLFENDIKLIKRNKRSKTTVGMSIMFSFLRFVFYQWN
jgi:hypothetical protein